MLEIASLETEFTTPEPEEQEVSTLLPEPAPEEVKAPTAEFEYELSDPTIPAPAAEESILEEQPEAAELELTDAEPDAAEPKIGPPEPQTELPQVDIDQELPHLVVPEPEPAVFNVDSPNLEPDAPMAEPELDAMKLSAPAAPPEPPEDLPTAEPVGTEEIPLTPAAEIPPVPPQRLAHPEIEPPKATPHYSPPDALLGEMGRVVAGESSPADILPPGVSPVETRGLPSDQTEKEAAERAGAKTPESSKERGEDTEVDPVALAREFSQLFDEPERNS
jgi:hypothetical protein